MEWSIEDVFKVINLYRQFPCLWDFRCSHYKRVDMKRNAWQEIARNMEKNEDEVKKKIKNLRSAYVSEKRKVESSKKSGSSPEDLYHPHLFYFDEMNFLNSSVMFRKTTSNFEREKSTTVLFDADNLVSEESCSMDNSLLCTTEISDTIVSQPVYTTSPIIEKPIKRKKAERDEKFNSAIDAFVRQANMSCSIMSSSNKGNEENMYSSFGKSISFQLAQLATDTAVATMSEIQDILAKKIINNNGKKDVLQTAILESDIF